MVSYSSGWIIKIRSVWFWTHQLALVRIIKVGFGIVLDGSLRFGSVWFWAHQLVLVRIIKVRLGVVLDGSLKFVSVWFWTDH